VKHVTSSKNYVGFNPLASDLFPPGRLLAKWTGREDYINTYLISSVWCNLDGDIQKRQKGVYN
jgi:hypothetical protein